MAPMAEKKPTEEKKAVKAPAERKPTSPLLPEIRKRKKKSVVTYKICIFTVLKQIHPDIGISSKAMGIMKL